MKRPLAIFGFAYLAGMLLWLWLPAAWLPFALLAVAVVLVALVLWWLRRKKQLAPVLALAALCLSLLVRFAYDAWVVAPQQRLAGEDHRATVRVLETEPGYSAETIHATLQVLQMDGEALRSPFRVRVSGVLPMEVGGIYSLPLRFSTHTTTSQRSYQYGRGYVLAAKALDVAEFEGVQHSFLTRMRSLQYAASENILSRLPQRLSSVLAAMSVGDRRYLAYDTTDAYRAAGLSHMLVVSGLHLSIVCVYLHRWLKKLLRRRWLAACASMGLLVLFMAFSGFSSSVLRSGFCWFLVFIADLFWRKADIYTSLALAAVILVSQNPYAAGDVGLLLSFGATLGALQAGQVQLVLRRRWLDRPLPLPAKLGRGLLFSILVPFCVTLATLPVLAWAGMSVTLFTIPMNIIAVPLLPLIVICGLALALPLPVWAAMPFRLLSGALLAFLEWLTQLCQRLPRASLPLGGALVLCVILVYYLLGFATWKTRRVLAGVLVAALLVPVVAALHIGLSAGTVRVVVAGSSAQSSLVVIRDNEAVVLYRSRQNANAIQSILKQNSVRECVLWVDMRRTADSTGDIDAFSPRQLVVANDDVLAGAVYTPLPQVEVSLARQGSGSVACVDVAGYKIGLCSGAVDLSPYGGLDVLLAGSGRVEGAYAALLVGGAVPDWAAPEAEVIYNDGTAALWLRPGRSVRFMEVRYGESFG